MLVEDGAEIGERTAHLPESAPAARHVGEMRRIVVASPAYLKGRGEPKRPQAIASHETIQFGATAASPEWHFVEDGSEVRIPCTPRFSTNSADAAIQHAERGGGLTRALAYPSPAPIKPGRPKITLQKF